MGTFLRDQAPQVLILGLSHIGCRSFNFSMFVCLSIKKVVPNNTSLPELKFVLLQGLE